MGGEQFFEKLHLDELGWIDGARVRTMYREMKSLHDARNENYLYFTWPLWTICAIELWFKSVFLSNDTSQAEWRAKAEMAALQN